MKIRNETNRPPHERVSGRPAAWASTISLGVLLVFLILPLSAYASGGSTAVTENCTIVGENMQRELAMHEVKYVPLFAAGELSPGAMASVTPNPSGCATSTLGIRTKPAAPAGTVAVMGKATAVSVTDFTAQ